MEQISLYFTEEICNIFPNESSNYKLYNSSSKVLSKSFQPSKFAISPKKEEFVNSNSTNEKTSINKNFDKNKKEINYDFRPICRKLDFSDNSDNTLSK